MPPLGTGDCLPLSLLAAADDDAPPPDETVLVVVVVVDTVVSAFALVDKDDAAVDVAELASTLLPVTTGVVAMSLFALRFGDKKRRKRCNGDQAYYRKA